MLQQLSYRHIKIRLGARNTEKRSHQVSYSRSDFMPRLCQSLQLWQECGVHDWHRIGHIPLQATSLRNRGQMLQGLLGLQQ